MNKLPVPISLYLLIYITINPMKLFALNRTVLLNLEVYIPLSNFFKKGILFGMYYSRVFRFVNEFRDLHFLEFSDLFLSDRRKITNILLSGEIYLRLLTLYLNSFFFVLLLPLKILTHIKILINLELLNS